MKYIIATVLMCLGSLSFSQLDSILVETFSFDTAQFIRPDYIDQSDVEDFGRHVITSGDGKTMAVFRARQAEWYTFTRGEDGLWVQKAPRHEAGYGLPTYSPMSLSYDGNVFAMTPSSGVVRILDYANGNWSTKGNQLSGFLISLSPDGNKVILRSSGIYKIYEYFSGGWQEIRSFSMDGVKYISPDFSVLMRSDYVSYRGVVEKFEWNESLGSYDLVSSLKDVNRFNEEFAENIEYHSGQGVLAVDIGHRVMMFKETQGRADGLYSDDWQLIGVFSPGRAFDSFGNETTPQFGLDMQFSEDASVFMVKYYTGTGGDYATARVFKIEYNDTKWVRVVAEVKKTMTEGRINTNAGSDIDMLSDGSQILFGVIGNLGIYAMDLFTDGNKEPVDLSPFDISMYCMPTPDRGTIYEDVIDDVNLGSINNKATGHENGLAYNDYTHLRTSLEKKKEYTLSLGITKEEQDVSAWIDFNQNGSFESYEKIGYIETEYEREIVDFSFVVPPYALEGNTLMRLTCVRFGETEPCGEFDRGEVEDYVVTIMEAGEREDDFDASLYCIPESRFGPSLGAYIDRVEFGNINNPNTGANDGVYYNYYSDFQAEFEQEKSYTLSVHTGSVGASNSYVSAWIDYDHDGIFDQEEEKLGEFKAEYGSQVIDIEAIIPSDAVLGNTLLRVRIDSKDSDSVDVPVSACSYNTRRGETEDYVINILDGGHVDGDFNISWYCVPESRSGPDFGIYIDQVKLEDIDNADSGGDDGPYYNNYSELYTANVEQGENYSIMIKTGSIIFSNAYISAWLDYDHNGFLDNENEKIDEIVVGRGVQQVNLPLTIPGDAVLGNTLLRVRIDDKDSDEVDVPVSSCAYNSTYGEVEDYVVRIIPFDDTPEEDYFDLSVYCKPTSVNGTSEGDFIDGVEFLSLNNLGTGGRSGSFYNDYTSYTVDVNQGSSYSIAITSGDHDVNYPTSYAAWIDYNQDGTFDELTEKLGEFRSSGANESADISFTVPANSDLDTTLLRIRAAHRSSNQINQPLEACEIYNWGEIEDYLVNISGPDVDNDDNNVGLAEDQFNSLNVYPNPCSDFLYFDNNESVNVQVLDLSGRVVLNEENVFGVLKVSNLSNGTYLIIIQGEREFRSRFTKID